MNGSTPGYQEALAWLFAQTRAGGARTPRRAEALLAGLGLAPPPLVVSVVGTNGKGSVTNMTAAGLTAAGRRTGRFLSPHVESFTERVAVDGAPVSERAVIEFAATAQRYLGTPGVREPLPAFFEWTLALALSEFRARGAGAAVLEAGVGGASDATRAVEPVDLTVITNVDLDHLDTLGPTLLDVARDKGGAIRPGVPVVSGVAQPEVRDLIATLAHERGAPLHQYLGEDTGEPLFALPTALSATVRGTRAANARLAAASLRLLGAPEAAVEAGLRAPPLPARGERFVLRAARAGGGPSEVEVLLDGAHDPAAAQRLLRELGGRRRTLLFGALARKQGVAVLELLAPGAAGVVITEATEGEGGTLAWPGASFVADPARALDAALDLALAEHGGGDERPLVLVAGSLYLAGSIRPLLRARGHRLAAPWEVAG